MEGQKAKYVPGERFTGIAVRRNRGMFVREGATHVGELQAWDIAAGKKRWSVTFEGPNWGPVLTTAGGLVFAGGTNDRYFRAYDAGTGEVLWKLRTNSGITGIPTSYSVDGIQYVAVQSGWGVDAQKVQSALDGIRGTSTFVPQGGVLWVFSLKRED
jgi:alcohol dehydrogenase (cytochrome c)